MSCREDYIHRPVDDLTALALAARDGDRVALSSFVRRTWPDVARLVSAVAGRDLAEDAAQDAYLRALRALPAYRGDAGARTWLLSIARRAAVDAVRSAARRRRLIGLLTARTTADQVTVGLTDGVLTDHALALLDVDRRVAFTLTQLMGFDYAAAAEICGCPIGTIRSRVARAREQLIAELGPARAAASPVSSAPPASAASPASAAPASPASSASPASPAPSAASASPAAAAAPAPPPAPVTPRP